MINFNPGRSNDFGAKMLWRILWVIEARDVILEASACFGVPRGGWSVQVVNRGDDEGVWRVAVRVG